MDGHLSWISTCLKLRAQLCKLLSNFEFDKNFLQNSRSMIDKSAAFVSVGSTKIYVGIQY